MKTNTILFKRLVRCAWYVHDVARYGRKNAAQLWYWQGRWHGEERRLLNEHYRALMLAVAGERSPAFLDGKVVADFGCGPRGSLCWADSARQRIGIDVLAKAYKRFGTKDHKMRYVSCSEREIPLPSNSVEVLFAICAMHYCKDLDAMGREMARILTTGGILIGSFNLDEPPNEYAPHTLTEQAIDQHILRRLEDHRCRVAPAGPAGDPYRYLIDPRAKGPRGNTRFMWVTARKPAE